MRKELTMMSRFLVPFQTSSRALGQGDSFLDLHREMNRLFDDFVGGGSGNSPSQSTVMAMPRLDVREGPQDISVCVELPGVTPSDVDVRVEGNVLTIRGEKKQEAPQEQHDYHLMERSFGRFQRSLQLPFAPDTEQVRASFEHGVLTVRVPKQPQQERSRRIEIQTQGSQGSAVQDANPTLSAPDTPQQPTGRPDPSHH
jgi:HSP20 family protein